MTFFTFTSYIFIFIYILMEPINYTYRETHAFCLFIYFLCGIKSYGGQKSSFKRLSPVSSIFAYFSPFFFYFLFTVLHLLAFPFTCFICVFTWLFSRLLVWLISIYIYWHFDYFPSLFLISRDNHIFFFYSINLVKPLVSHYQIYIHSSNASNTYSLLPVSRLITPYINAPYLRHFYSLHSGYAQVLAHSWLTQ